MYRSKGKGRGGCEKGGGRNRKGGKGRGSPGKSNSSADRFPGFTFQADRDCREMEKLVKDAARRDSQRIWVDRSRFFATQIIVHVQTADLDVYMATKRAILSLVSPAKTVHIPVSCATAVEACVFTIEERARVSSIVVDDATGSVQIYGSTADEAEQAVLEC